ncbi:MAG: helicase [Pseudomonadales bacterium]|nr:helicase [Pseudomonadales bacterium]
MIKSFLLWLQKIEFSFLLWGLGFRMSKKANEEGAFKQHLDGKDIVLQFQTEDKKSSRHYVIKDQTVRSISGAHREPTTVLSFESAGYALMTLKKRDPMAFMQGVQEKKIVSEGDAANVMWFMGAVKLLK